MMTYPDASGSAAAATAATDRLAALTAIVNSEMTYKSQALQTFYQDWQHEPLVINQSFQVQAMCSLPGTLDRVKELMQHPAFDIGNRNGNVCEPHTPFVWFTAWLNAQ